MSAGILLCRWALAGPEVLPTHPGGPCYASQDAGIWGVLKSLADPGEDLLLAARRRINPAQATLLDRLEVALAAQQRPRGGIAEGATIMISKIVRITLVVASQHEALKWYTEKLGFLKRADFPMGPGARWITVAPPDDADLEIVPQLPDWFQGEERQRKAAQIGQNPSVVLRVDDCHATCAELEARGVEVAGPPEQVPWGLQAVVKDLYGNDLVLLQPA